MRRFFRFEQRLLAVPALIVLASCATVPEPTLEPPALVCRQVVPDPAQTVSWIAPEADRDRARLREWCAAVGPVFYEPSPPARAGLDPPPLDRLAIISWNTHVAAAISTTSSAGFAPASSRTAGGSMTSCCFSRRSTAAARACRSRGRGRW